MKSTDNYLANERRLQFLDHERHLLQCALDDAVSPVDMLQAIANLNQWDDAHGEEWKLCERIDNQYDTRE